MSFDLENAKLQVRNFIERYPINTYLVKASEKTQVEKEYIFLGSIALLFLLVFLVTGGDVIIDIIGFVYPFYMSLKAIETEESEDDKQWLTYWIVFVLFKLVENIADVLISFIPFYFAFKVAFLVWCCHPSFKGATLVYDLVIKTYIVPSLGIRVASMLASTKKKSTEKPTPYFEVTINKVVLNTTVPSNEADGSEEDSSEGLFVEVAAAPPAGVVRSSAGLEGTFFKTQVGTGTSIDFQHKIVISPLPHSDGFLQLLVKQKHTYGDDVVVGERADVQIASFLQSKGGDGCMVITVGSYDVTLTAKYVGA